MYSCVTTTNNKELFYRSDRQGKKHRVSRKKMEQLSARFDKAFPTCEPSKALLLSNTLAALAALQVEKADLSSTLATKLGELSTSAKDLTEKQQFLAAAQAEIQQAKDLILGLEGKVQLTETDVANLKQTVSDLRFDLEKVLKEKEEITNEYGVTKAQLLQEIAAITGNLTNTQGLLDKEQMQVETLTKNLKDLEEAKKVALSECNLTIATISDKAQTDLAALNKVLNDKTSELYLEIETIKGQYGDLQKRADAITGELNIANNTIDTLRSNLKTEQDKSIECAANVQTIQAQLETTTKNLQVALQEKQSALVNSAKITGDKQRQILALANLKKQLQQDLATAKSELKNSQREVETLSAELNSEKLASIQTRNDLDSKIQILTSTLDQTKSNLATVISQNESLTSSLNTTQDDFNTFSVKSKKDLDDAVEQYGVCNAKIISIQAENTTLVNQKQEEIDGLALEINRNKAESDSRIATLRESIDLYEREIKENNAKIQALMTEKQTLSDSYNTAQQTILSQSGASIADNMALQESKLETEAAKEQVEACNTRIVSIQAENAKIAEQRQAEVDILNTVINSANADTSSRINALRDSVNLLNQEIKSNNAQIQRLMKEKETLIGKSAKLKDVIQNLAGKNKTDREAISTYQEQIKAYAKRQDDLLAELSKAASVSAELATTKTQLHDANSQIQILNDKLTTSGNSLLVSQQQGETQKNNTQIKVNALMKSVSALSKEKSELARELKTLQSNIATLQKDLTDAAVDLNTARNELKNVQSELAVCMTGREADSATLIDVRRQLENSSKSSKDKDGLIANYISRIDSLVADNTKFENEITSLKSANDVAIDNHQKLMNKKMTESKMQADKITALTQRIEAITIELNAAKQQKLESISAGAKTQEQDVASIVQAVHSAITALKSTTVQSQAELAALQQDVVSVKNVSDLVKAIKSVEGLIARVEGEHDELAKDVDRYKQEVLVCQQQKSTVQTQLDSAVSRCTDSFAEICLKDESGATKCFDDLSARYPTANSCFKDAKAGAKCIEKILSNYPDIVGLKIDDGKVTTLLVGDGEDLVEGVLPIPIPVQTQISDTILPLIATNPGLKKVVDSIELSKADGERVKKALEGVQLEVEQSQSKFVAKEAELSQVKDENKRLAELISQYETEKELLTKQLDDLTVSFSTFQQNASKQLSDAAKVAQAECQAQINNIRSFASCTASESNARECIEELSKMFPQRAELPGYLLNLGTTVTNKTCVAPRRLNKSGQCVQPSMKFK